MHIKPTTKLTTNHQHISSLYACPAVSAQSPTQSNKFKQNTFVHTHTLVHTHSTQHCRLFPRIPQCRDCAGTLHTKQAGNRPTTGRHLSGLQLAITTGQAASIPPMWRSSSPNCSLPTHSQSNSRSTTTPSSSAACQRAQPLIMQQDLLVQCRGAAASAHTTHGSAHTQEETAQQGWRCEEASHAGEVPLSSLLEAKSHQHVTTAFSRTGQSIISCEEPGRPRWDAQQNMAATTLTMR